MIIFSKAFIRKMDKIIETSRVSARRALISYVYDEMVSTGLIVNTTLREFKKFILKLNAEGSLELSSVDTVGKWGATQLKRSRTKSADGTFLHLIHRKSKIQIAEKPVKRPKGEFSLTPNFVRAMDDIIALNKISPDKSLVNDVYKGLMRSNKITSNTTLVQFKKFIKLGAESGKISMTSIGLAAMWGGNTVVKKSVISFKGKDFHLINRTGKTKQVSVLEYSAGLHSTIDSIIETSPISQRRALVSYVYKELVSRKKISKISLEEFKSFLLNNKHTIALDYAESPDIWGRKERSESEMDKDSYHLIVHRTIKEDQPKVDSRHLSFSNFNPTGTTDGKAVSTDKTVVLNADAPPPEQTLIDIDNVIEKNKQSQYNAPISYVYDQLIKSKKIGDTTLDTFRKSLLKGAETGRVMLSQLLRGDWDNNTLNSSRTVKGTAVVNRSPAAARTDAVIQKGITDLGTATAAAHAAESAARLAKSIAKDRESDEQKERVKIATSVVAADITESEPLVTGISVNEDTNTVPPGLINQINAVIRSDSSHPNQGTIHSVYKALVKTKALINTTLIDFKSFLEFVVRANKGISLSYADHPDVWGGGLNLSAIRIGYDIFHLIDHSNPIAVAVNKSQNTTQGPQVIPINIAKLDPLLPFETLRKKIEWIVRTGPVSPRAATTGYVYNELLKDTIKKIPFVKFKTFLGEAHNAGNIKLISSEVQVDTDFRAHSKNLIRIASGNYTLIANTDSVGYMHKYGSKLMENEHDEINDKFIPAVAEIIKLYPDSNKAVPISYVYNEMYNSGNMIGRMTRKEFDIVIGRAWRQRELKLTDNTIKLLPYILDASATFPEQNKGFVLMYAEKGIPRDNSDVVVTKPYSVEVTEKAAEERLKNASTVARDIEIAASGVTMTDFSKKPSIDVFAGVMKKAAETATTGWDGTRRVLISHAKANSIYRNMPADDFLILINGANGQKGGDIELSTAGEKTEFSNEELRKSRILTLASKSIYHFINVYSGRKASPEKAIVDKKAAEGGPSLKVFADNIQKAANSSTDGKFGERKVFIETVKKNSAYSGMDRITFEKMLRDANRESLITLSRLDLVAEFSSEYIDSTEMPIHERDVGKSDFAGDSVHFVNVT